jgi:hypothetical protein
VKFTGQVRIPEVDHPGVPATIVVEGDQTEVFLEGESLGRWSLFDVHASRLVSSAFSLSLGAEEITFIADEPVDFAYKGVDHMAEAWARFKSMSLPRRVVAVGRSRRGTVASRIPELREAMLSNLESVGRPAARLVPVERLGEAVPKPASWTKRIDAYSRVPEPLEEGADAARPRPSEESVTPKVEVVSADDKVAAVFEPAPIVEEAPEAATVEMEPFEAEAPRAVPPKLRPGPGLVPRPAPAPSADPEQVFTPPPERGPLAASPWEEPPVAEENRDDDPGGRSGAAYEEADQKEAPEPVSAGPQADVEVDEPAGVASATEAFEEPEPDVPEAESKAAEEGEAVESEVVPRRGDEARHEVVVDLGHFESGDEDDRSEEDEGYEGDFESPADPGSTVKEPVLAGAPVASTERGGLLGAVRSAFARNRGSHEHEFVEAPGGIGIVRQICAECGYISIGVTD